MRIPSHRDGERAIILGDDVTVQQIIGAAELMPDIRRSAPSSEPLFAVKEDAKIEWLSAQQIQQRLEQKRHPFWYEMKTYYLYPGMGAALPFSLALHLYGSVSVGFVVGVMCLLAVLALIKVLDTFKRRII